MQANPTVVYFSASSPDTRYTATCSHIAASARTKEENVPTPSVGTALNLDKSIYFDMISKHWGEIQAELKLVREDTKKIKTNTTKILNLISAGLDSV